MLEHYLFMQAETTKNILDNSTNKEVDELRGLYLCLNYIKISKLNYDHTISNCNKSSLIKMELKKLLEKYCSVRLS
jgi:hypothetical protein